jgi:hypothetical protein
MTVRPTSENQPATKQPAQTAATDNTTDVLVAALKEMMAKGSIEMPAQPTDAAEGDDGEKP